MNLLQSAQTQLNASTLPSMAGHLGIESEVLPKLVEEALPSLFTILGKAAQEPSKAALVTQFLSEIDAGILAEPNAILSEHGAELTRSGKTGLAKMLGPQLTDHIAPLAKSTGLGEGKIATALGTLAPFVIALLSQKTKEASELQTLLTQEGVTDSTQDTITAPKEETSQKSYLPDPNKKREKRPFPKRKALLFVFVLALVAALLFWLIHTGVIPLGNPSPTESPKTSATPTTPANGLPFMEGSLYAQLALVS